MIGYRIPHFGLKRQTQQIKTQLLDASEKALVSGCWNDGPFAEEFQEWLKIKTKTQYAVLCHSGTQALEIIAKHEVSSMPENDPYASWAYDKEAYRTIRVPNLTYPATLNAFLNAGMNVELCDVDSNGIMVKNTDSENPKLECYVGLYGHPVPKDRFEYPAIIDGAQHWLVADGDIGLGMAISFDPTKNLPSSGNGGAIVTNDKALYDFAIRYRDNGKPEHYDPGTNSKMSEQDCAQILVRTKYLDYWQTRRKKIREYYLERFEKLEQISCFSAGCERHADQKFVLRVDPNIRDELHLYLSNYSNIDTKMHYDYVLSDLNVSGRCVKKPDILSASHVLSKSVLSLPIYPELTDNEVVYIADSVERFFIKQRLNSSVF